MATFVFDRTLADVQAMNAKGTYNASDLNRVINAIDEIAAELTGIGIPTTISWLKSSYADTDIPTEAQMNEYLANVAIIKAALPNTSPNVPGSMAYLTYDKANDIEKILYEIETLINNMGSIFPKSGLYNSGAVIYPVDTTVKYQRRAYLISTKGIKIVGTKLGSTTEIRARVYRPSDAAGQYIYQSDSGSSLTTNFTAYTSAGNASANWRMGNKTASIAVPTGDWHETKQNKSGVWIDDTKVATYTSVSEFTSVNDLTIHGTAASANMRIAWIERYVDAALVATYLPVYSYDEEKYGYYDTSSGKFYTNDEATITAGGVI